ncbi:hypothetical protein [Hansschlegelia zhihuaiae]|uniref:Uncharacterized protein n=1 Tax=Hansschlegelia zhihuaiae TaxID=405005 RepID=A0A4Q0M4C3_9HYPH|nr:hypothetical protein [Hansschlegelia zhihuaiae]RXF67673.1 hypothetical protein EK403_20940 [Hansschlegelia zhihuaiae]
MPFRVSSGPSVGRTIIVSHSAAEALRLFRALQDEGAENVEISHLEKGELSIEEVVALAADEPTLGREATP